MALTLYHGTLKLNARQILRGAVPKVGPLVLAAYGRRVGLRPYLFASDDPENTIEPMLFHIEQQHGLDAVIGTDRTRRWTHRHPGRRIWLPRLRAIEKYGAVAVFENPDWEAWQRGGRESPAPIEPGNWYTSSEVKPTRVVTGKKLLEVVGWA